MDAYDLLTCYEYHRFGQAYTAPGAGVPSPLKKRKRAPRPDQRVPQAAKEPQLSQNKYRAVHPKMQANEERANKNAELYAATGMSSSDPAAKRAKSTAAVNAKEQSKDDSHGDLKQFFKAWAWKREHRPDRERFHRPYVHELHLPSTAPEQQPGVVQLSIKQQKFGPQGFASTVWDSSIVVSKFLEHQSHLVRGKRTCDLSAGCGLIAVTLARLGAAAVTATDLEPNLALLSHNCEANAPGQVEVKEHSWGQDISPLGPPFDLVVACDVMYISEPQVVKDLVTSLAALISPAATATVTAATGAAATATAATAACVASAQAAGLTAQNGAEQSSAPVPAQMQTQAKAGRKRKAPPTDPEGISQGVPSGQQTTEKGANKAGADGKGTSASASGRSGSKARAALAHDAPASRPCIIMAHGRNRFGEEAFKAAAAAWGLRMEDIGEDELHPDYQCSDVSVYRLFKA